MYRLQNFSDAQQQALSFLRHQLTIVEPQVYRIQYPDVQYPELVPVGTVGWEWAKSVTYTSLNSVGMAQWMHGSARDFPVADITVEQFETMIEMAAVGYRYTVEELAVTQRLGISIGTEKAEAARRAYQEFIDDIVFRGNTDKGWEGLINQSTGVTVIDAADVGDENGGTNSPYWVHKTAMQIKDDFNLALTNIHIDSLQVEMADTVLMPLEEMTRLAQMQMPNLPSTVLGWIQAHNMYTLQTGRPLTIRAIRGLEDASDAGGGRMVVYRRDPGVLKFHLPMPHRFLPIWQPDPFTFFVPGIFRVGGLEIRRPMAVRYVDDISAPPA